MKPCECGCGQPVRRRFVQGHNRRIAIATRFWEKVDKRGPDDCWEWLGSRSRGYGALKRVGCDVPIAAHRFAYELLIGPIPEGLQIDHLCRNRGCVNPAHLEAVTQQENMRRGLKGVLGTHCPHGHPLDGWDRTANGGAGCRYCKTCKRNRVRERRQKAIRLG